MKVEYIDGELLKNMVVAGAQSLENNKKLVNALNVFPVPDGDTGTNMALTMQSAVKEVKSSKSNALSVIADAVANGSLMGARGNSGVILSQLFRGFAKGVKDKEKLNTTDLANAFKNASDTAYKAVMKPTEGTILTVARESAEKALEICKKEKDIVSFLEKVIFEAEETLKRTPDMLEVLKEAGVVDSGGKGLVLILQGGLGAITGETVNIEEEQEQGENEVSSYVFDENIEFGYCTEFIINGDNIDTDRFKSLIETYGDSMLVVGNENVAKVHIHTNNPGEVMEQGLKLGELSDIKIDNMRKQHSHQVFEENVVDKKDGSKKEEKKKYAFITVTMGEGLTNIFKDFNVDHVIEGGQTMNPSTEDFLKAIDALNAETIYILPNNSNIIMAANQAKEISKENIKVIPSKSVPQGIAALVAFNDISTADENEQQMTEALKEITTGQVTYAVRDTSINDLPINKGDIIGIGNNDIKSVGDDVNKVSIDLLSKIVTEEHEMVTVFYGEDLTNEEADLLSKQIEQKFPEHEIELYYGGQSIYYYIFSIE
ncbi:DAK2 domain-containing protein [Serpentinicella sp. ANB-PHB4]|uniref:DAK2 domain-containing protein n=1 Tax=Serpentinicella sp. ANB-PHB4 TaxID=3074076 RepID=UPI002861C303|nr:DAK2 domain-containing protein [Serpentinicella sp. ANB-PHB4]MDR5658310.1 DAK2 domain-containing protein [Serpentinicella sp. ANB-PHB4]